MQFLTRFAGGAASADFPTLFLRSSTRWRHIDELAEFLQVSPSMFPEDSRHQHTRKSTRPLAPEIASLVEETFQNLTAMQKSLGEFYVVPRANSLSSLFSNIATDSLAGPSHPALTSASFQVATATGRTTEALIPLMVISNVVFLGLSLGLVAWIFRNRRASI
jgi:hypothetical protein